MTPSASKVKDLIGLWEARALPAAPSTGHGEPLVKTLIAAWEAPSSLSSLSSSSSFSNLRPSTDSVTSSQTGIAPRLRSSSSRASTQTIYSTKSKQNIDFRDDLAREKLFDKDLFMPGLKNGERAYNGGITQHRGQTVMAFRLETPARRRGEGHDNSIAVVALSNTFDPVGDFSVLLTNNRPHQPNTSEDPRIFDDNGQLRVVYNLSQTGHVLGQRLMHLGNVEMTQKKDGTFTFRLVADWTLIFSMVDRPMPNIEKNWSPFVYDNKVHFIYDSESHVVARIDDDLASKASGTDLILCQVTQPVRNGLRWDAGHCRGGTQALYDEGLDRYITFFHSSSVNPAYKGKNDHPELTYFVGCATFYPSPPFALEKMSKSPIMLDGYGRELLRQNEDYGKKIIFPQGLILEKDRFILSYGRGDWNVAVCSIDRQRVLDGLEMVR